MQHLFHRVLQHKEMELATQKEFGATFTLKNSDGALLGPFAPLLCDFPLIPGSTAKVCNLVTLLLSGELGYI
jgi:hypothetical protein